MHIVPRGSGAIDSKPVSRSFGVLLLRMTAGAYCLEHSQNDVTASPTRPLCHPELAEGSCPKLKSQEPLPVTPFPIRPYPTGERSPLPQAYFKILRSIAPQDDSGGEIRGSASFSRKLISKSFVAPLLRMTKGGVSGSQGVQVLTVIVQARSFDKLRMTKGFLPLSSLFGITVLSEHRIYSGTATHITVLRYFVPLSS